jgi:hypothetical protein
MGIEKMMDIRMRNGATYKALKIVFGGWENKTARLLWGNNLHHTMDIQIKDIEFIELDE